MRRLVVKEVPEASTLIQPSKSKPGFTKSKTVVVEEEDGQVTKEESIFVPWKLDSSIARLIGEAKSLPKGYALKLTSASGIGVVKNHVAWFTNKNGIDLVHYEDSYYLRKREEETKKKRKKKVDAAVDNS